MTRCPNDGATHFGWQRVLCALDGMQAQARFAIVYLVMMPLLGVIHWRLLRRVQRWSGPVRARAIRWLHRLAATAGLLLIVYLFRWYTSL